MLRELGDEYTANTIVLNLAESEFQAGDAETALRLAEEGLASMVRRGSTVRSLTNIPAYLVALDRFDEALTHAREMVARSAAVPHNVRFFCALQHLLAAATLRLPPSATGAAYRDAARVLGFLDAGLAGLGSAREYTERQEYERLLHRLGAVLDAEELARSMAAGATLSVAGALEVAERLAGDARNPVTPAG